MKTPSLCSIGLHRWSKWTKRNELLVTFRGPEGVPERTGKRSYTVRRCQRCRKREER